MVPKQHLIYGAAFSAAIWAIAPEKVGFNAFTIIAASVLIDADHYLVYISRQKNFNLQKTYRYFREMHADLKNKIKSGYQVKAPFFIFHTLEFLIIIALLSLLNGIFIFILIGLLFHFLLDIVDMHFEFKNFNPRDYSIIQYIINRKRKKFKYL